MVYYSGIQLDEILSGHFLFEQPQYYSIISEIY